jgi:hypothetical protein
MGTGLCHFHSIMLIFRPDRKNKHLWLWRIDRPFDRLDPLSRKQFSDLYLLGDTCISVKSLLSPDRKVRDRSILGKIGVSNALFAVCLEKLPRSLCSEQLSEVAVNLSLMP